MFWDLRNNSGQGTYARKAFCRLNEKTKQGETVAKMLGGTPHTIPSLAESEIALGLLQAAPKLTGVVYFVAPL